MRERAVLHPDEENVVELEPLGRVEGDEKDPLPLVRLVGVGAERDRVEEAGEGRVVPFPAGGERPLVLARGREKLVEVLPPRLVLGVGGLLVEGEEARLREDGGDRRRGAQALVPRRLAEPQDERTKLAERFLRPLGHPRREGGQRAEERRRAPGGRGLERLHRRGADPACRDVHDAPERDVVVRVPEEAKVGEGVLHLGALIELRPADEEVRHVRAEKLVLERPRLRVRPEEDRDRSRGVLPPRPHEARDDFARLVPLLVEGDQADLLPPGRVARSVFPSRRLFSATTAPAASRIAPVER